MGWETSDGDGDEDAGVDDGRIQVTGARDKQKEDGGLEKYTRSC